MHTRQALIARIRRGIILRARASFGNRPPLPSCATNSGFMVNDRFVARFLSTSTAESFPKELKGDELAPQPSMEAPEGKEQRAGSSVAAVGEVARQLDDRQQLSEILQLVKRARLMPGAVSGLCHVLFSRCRLFPLS